MDMKTKLNYSRDLEGNKLNVKKAVSVTTVQCLLCDYGLKDCISAKKLLLFKQSKIKRLNWTRKHKN